MIRLWIQFISSIFIFLMVFKLSNAIENNVQSKRTMLEQQQNHFNWCPKPCKCHEEKNTGTIKKLPSFWLSTATNDKVERHRYQVNRQHQVKQHQQQPQQQNVDVESDTRNGERSLATRFRIDCGRKKIDDVKRLLSNSSQMFYLYVQNQQQQKTMDSTSSSTTNSNLPLKHPNSIINTMNLNQNKIVHIDSSIFGHKFWQRHLKNLLLNDNFIQRIPNGTFVRFSSLQYLNLASNLIVILEQHSFLGLSKLLKLDLGSNRIKTFPSSSISPSVLVSLSEINLRQNLIEWIPSMAFNYQKDRQTQPLPTLTQNHNDNGNTFHYNSTRNNLVIINQIINFDLSQNPLTKIDLDAFVKMPRLRKIYLSEVQSQEDFPNLFGSNMIEHIRFDRSRLRSIDPDLCQHVGNTLKSLFVKSNHIDRLPPLDLCSEIRLLDISYNRIKSIGSYAFRFQQKLIDLSLNDNEIEVIAQNAFVGLTNLKVLNMQNNFITQIDSDAFSPLQSLRDLNLGHNYFSELPTKGLTNLIEIKVHGNRNLREFPPVESFPYVQTLAMSYAYHCCPYLGRMQVINPDIAEFSKGPFDPLSKSPDLHDSILWLEDINDSNLNLTITELAQQFWKLYNPYKNLPVPTDLGNNENEEISYDMFAKDLYAAIETPASYQWGDTFEDDDPKGDSNVYFQSNDRVTNQPIKCLPKPDPFMPCKDLFDWWTLRLGVWIVFPLALIGNGTVLIVLVFGRRKRRRSSKLDVPRFLVCNLAAADFFMGVYLGILALVDVATLGYFRSHAIRWQNSFLCQFTGFTGVFSSELSVFTLAVITLERNYAITHAMHLNKRLSLRAASIVMSIGWIFALLMSVLPLFGVNDYRKVAVCLPFQIDNLVSMIYVISLIVFNGLAFLLLMACYLRMYCAIRGSQAWNSNDTRIAMRMGLLVFTDFLCWAPIAFFTITELTGWSLITLEEAKIFTIFVLPLNACANPFLYAFFTKQFKKECANLYKRMDTLKLFRSRRRSSNQPPSNADLTPAIMSDCKICGHRDKHQQVPNFYPTNAVLKQNRHHSNFRRILSITSNSENDSKAEMNIENNNNNDINNGDKKEKELNPEKIPKNENNTNQLSIKDDEKDPASPKQEVEQCSCDCHHHQLGVRFNPIPSSAKNPTSRMVRSESGTYAAGPFTKHFISSLSSSSSSKGKTSKHRRRQRRSAQTKQFKSNSIIYQSNYRKNHVHMMLENETSYRRPNNDNGSESENHQNDQIIPESDISIHKINDKSVGDENDKRSPIRELDGQNLNSFTGYDQDSNKDTIQRHQRYMKNNQATNAMTSGILMIKNKFTRSNNSKNYIRKLSSDSQYEFSYYSNRKDSTSTTGRLSFSSDNPTRSTSSTFFSSGIWSSSRTGASESQDRELLLSQDQYQRLAGLSKDFDESAKNSLLNNSGMDYELFNMSEYHNSNNNSLRYILLSLNEQELHNILFEKPRFVYNPIDRTKSSHPTTKIDEETLIKIKDIPKYHFHLLYLLDKINPLNRSKFVRNDLEVFLLCTESLRKELKQKMTEFNDIDEDYLIEKLMEHLNNSKEFKTEEDFANLAIFSSILKCQFRLINSELDEINEETNSLTNNGGSNNRLEDSYRKSQVGSKRISNSHEKIMNFLQTLLSKSSKQNTNSSNKKSINSSSSFYRKPRVKKPQSVVTKPIRCGQRRSSSAFALNDELLEDFHKRRMQEKNLNVKSYSQFLVADSSEGSISHKSDSVPEIRSRSAVSDVIIRINSGTIRDLDNDNDVNDIKETIKHQASSDQQLSYDNFQTERLNVEHNIKRNYHSSEYII